MSTESERLQILEMIESGKITPAEGVALLESLGSEEASEDVAGSWEEEGPGQVEISAFIPPSQGQVLAEMEIPEIPLPPGAPPSAPDQTSGTTSPDSGSSAEA